MICIVAGGGVYLRDRVPHAPHGLPLLCVGGHQAPRCNEDALHYSR